MNFTVLPMPVGAAGVSDARGGKENWGEGVREVRGGNKRRGRREDGETEVWRRLSQHSPAVLLRTLRLARRCIYGLSLIHI